MKKPFVVINSAITADGKISTKKRIPTKISSKEDFERVKNLRDDFDAIMIGVGTLLADDPELKGKNLIRIIVDSEGKTPPESEIFDQKNVVLAVSKKIKKKRIEKLEKKAKIIVCGEEKVNLKKLLPKLRDLNIDKLLVEGGGTLNWSLFKHKLVDRLITYIGSLIFGGERAPTLVDGEGVEELEDAIKLKLISCDKLGEGILLKWDLIKN